MTESSVAAPAHASAEPREAVYSKDYWDLVFEQLARRPLFKLGLAILALLYASAIYAPLIASDRPLVLQAVDYKAYGTALRTLSPVAATIVRRLAQTPEEYLSERGPDAPPTQAEALVLDLDASRQRYEVLYSYLPREHHAAIEPFREKIQGAVELGLAGEREAGLALAEEAKDLARELRTALQAVPPPAAGAEPVDGGAQDGAIVLVGVTSYPLFESLSPWEVLFMVGWLWMLTWPLWNRFLNRIALGGERGRIRAWRRKKVALVLGSSALAAVLWALLVGGGGSAFDVARYKAGLTSGDIIAVRPPIWPPIAIGYAETHTEEMFRPPTWISGSELDENGYYVRGPRVPMKDPATGMFPPANPVEVRVGEPVENSPLRHLAGTDELGRDFFVRMLWGGRVSLAVGILSAALLTVIGVVMGCLAGYFGGRIDIAIMRLIEILQSIPALFLILFAMAFIDPNVVPPIIAIVVVIALIRWTGVARLVRGEFLRLREQEFVLAARALGFSNRRTIFRHVLPNAMSPVLVSAAFAVAAGILTESVISYLGFGIQHPGASWGSLVNESKSADHWWVQVFPGILIFITVTCYNLVGDAVRDALDPKMKV